MKKLLLLLALTIFFQSCDSNDYGNTEECELSGWFPLEIGNYWVYQRSTTGMDVIDSAVVEEMKEHSGRQAAIIKVYRNKELQEVWSVFADDTTVLLYSWALAPVFRSGCDTTLSDWRSLIGCGNEWTSEYSGKKKVHLLDNGKIVEAEITSNVTIRCIYKGIEEVETGSLTINSKRYDYHMEMEHTLAPESEYVFENGAKTRNLDPVDASLWIAVGIGIVKTGQENNERLLLRYFIQ